MFLTRKQLVLRFINRAMLAVISAAMMFSLYMLMFFVFLATN